MTIQELKSLKESEDKVEFKAATKSYNYAGGKRTEPKDRRKCVLGYVTAFCNEGGGSLVLGINDKSPHEVVGSDFAEGLEGKLIDKIYTDINIRVKTETLFDKESRRVLVIKIPSRPIGKIMKFEGIGLMRTGESLREMSDQETFRILSEQEPDFSATICKNLKLEDLDKDAIDEFKNRYAQKQNNPIFLTQKTEQILHDLNLSKKGKLTYATLILFGKKTAIRTFLPQSSVSIEYRQEESSIPFNSRKIFQGAIFLELKKIWDFINLRNGKVQTQHGIYIHEIPLFNEEVIRESILNAITHRDYKMASEILIKQYPSKLVVSNPGGLPHGVTFENILTINSTPRNRLLADVLLKAGLVERSGQGVDKMFFQCIAESKDIPDYSKSDFFQVTLKISSLIRDPAFVLFINDYQLKNKEKLGVMEIITLNQIREGQKRSEIDINLANQLIKMGLVEKRGKTKNSNFILSMKYYKFIDKKGEYSNLVDLSEDRIVFIIIDHLNRFRNAKMKDFVNLFENKLTRKQVTYRIHKLVKGGSLDKFQQGKKATYSISKNHEKTTAILNKALEIGLEHLRKNAPDNEK